MAPASKSRSRTGTGLSSLLMPELQRIAQTMGIPGAGRMRKGQLVEAIEARQGGGPRQETLPLAEFGPAGRAREPRPVRGSRVLWNQAQTRGSGIGAARHQASATPRAVASVRTQPRQQLSFDQRDRVRPDERPDSAALRPAALRLSSAPAQPASALQAPAQQAPAQGGRRAAGRAGRRPGGRSRVRRTQRNDRRRRNGRRDDQPSRGRDQGAATRAAGTRAAGTRAAATTAAVTRAAGTRAAVTRAAATRRPGPGRP